MMESRTGVYYQAMPAVGPDGKNVMKLIPVQKVNGKFVQTQAVAERVDCQPQVYSDLSHLSPVSLQQNKLPALEPTSDARFILKTGPVSNTLSNPAKSQHQVTSNSPLASKLTPNALQLNLQNSSKAATLINSPQPQIFPTGHYLQIPSNATVRTFPASALPQSIKTQIYRSSNIPSNPAKGLPTVVYVSPVNSLKLGPKQQLTGLTKASELPQSLGPHALSTITDKNLNTSSTSSPKAAQGVTTPMKWVVQEGTGNGAPCLIPVTSPNMTSDLLKAVKHMETVRTTNKAQAGEPTSAPAVQEKITPGKDNALVMCNGKVYFVAKKNSEISKDMISGAGNKLIVRNSVQPSSGPCADSNTAQKQDPKITLSNKKPSEIIDLCDDDDESFVCAGSGGLTVGEKDEDSNVIFVSYIPPKSETDTSKKVAENSAPQNGHSEDMHSDVENVEENCERNRTSSPVAAIDVSTCDDKADANESANGAEEEEVCCQEVSEKAAEDSVVQPRQSDDLAETSVEQPVLEEKLQQKSDSELRRIFGITSDPRICLQKMNQVKEQISEVERKTINKCTLEGIRKRIQESQIELKIKQLIQSKVSVSEEENGPNDAKRPRLEQDGQKYVDTSSPQPKDAVSCDEEMQSVSTDASTDDSALLCSRGPEEETPSTSGSTEVTEQTAEPLGSSSSSSSSFQPLETQTAKIDTDSTLSISRKTPARQSKGSGRLCTVCPCGTKVGVMPTIPSSKPQEKANSEVQSPEQANGLTEAKRNCSTVDKVPENSVSNPKTSSDVSDKPGDEKAHTGQSNVKPGKGSLQKTASHTTQIESVSQPDMSLKGKTCSSIASQNDTQGKTCENGTGGPAAPTTMHEPNNPKEVKVKVPSTLFAKTLPRDAEKGPTEFYSSIMLDPEEVERRQRIKRLKDLLRQKEAALEKLRKSM